MYEYRVQFINDDGLMDMVEFYSLVEARKFKRELSADSMGVMYKIIYHARGVEYAKC